MNKIQIMKIVHFTGFAAFLSETLLLALSGAFFLHNGKWAGIVLIIFALLCVMLLSRFDRLRMGRYLYKYRDPELFNMAYELYKKKKGKKSKGNRRNEIVMYHLEFKYQTTPPRDFLSELNGDYRNLEIDGRYWFLKAKTAYLAENYPEAISSSLEFLKKIDQLSNRLKRILIAYYGGVIEAIFLSLNEEVPDIIHLSRRRFFGIKPESYLWRGIYYNALGNRGKACEEWKQLVFIGKDYNDAKTASLLLGDMSIEKTPDHATIYSELHLLIPLISVIVAIICSWSLGLCS